MFGFTGKYSTEFAAGEQAKAGWCNLQKRFELRTKDENESDEGEGCQEHDVKYVCGAVNRIGVFLWIDASDMF